MGIDDWKKKKAEKRAAKEVEADAEFTEKVEPILVEKDFDEDHVMRVKTKEIGEPNWLVFDLPSPAIFQRFRATYFKDRQDRGSVEAKAKAGAQLAKDCVVYPSRDEYVKLVTKYTAIEDAAGKHVYDLAEVEAAALEKG